MRGISWENCYEKITSVIHSCDTESQVKSARNMIVNFENNTQNPLSIISLWELADFKLAKILKMKIKIVEGVKFEVSDDPIKDGDYYIAEKNVGPELLKAKKVDVENGWIVPFERAYLYDIGNCQKVINMLD